VTTAPGKESYSARAGDQGRSLFGEVLRPSRSALPQGPGRGHPAGHRGWGRVLKLRAQPNGRSRLHAFARGSSRDSGPGDHAPSRVGWTPPRCPASCSLRIFQARAGLARPAGDDSVNRGTLAYDTGSLLVDHGWLGFVDCGHPRLTRTLTG